ncbi:MAG: hypothetical protein ACJ790_08465 [Myxococcaceae bacterium]
MATHKVGGEVDAFCTRCKMTLAHTILAMVGTKIARVKCNTCGGDHAYRSAPGASTSAAPRKPRASAKGDAPAKVVLGWTQRMAERDPASAKKYSVKESFAVDDLIDHPTFGMGFVTLVRGDKVDVSFKTEKKTLMHGKAGGISQDKPKYAPPSSARAGPADKPQVEGDEASAPAAEPSEAAESTPEG